MTFLALWNLFMHAAGGFAVGYFGCAAVHWLYRYYRRNTFEDFRGFRDEVAASIGKPPADYSTDDALRGNWESESPWLGTYNPPRAETDCVITGAINQPAVSDSVTLSREQLDSLNCDNACWQEQRDGRLEYISVDFSPLVLTSDPETKSDDETTTTTTTTTTTESGFERSEW